LWVVAFGPMRLFYGPPCDLIVVSKSMVIKRRDLLIQRQQ